MEFKFSLLFFVLWSLTGNTYASLQICFTKDGRAENITFNHRITFEEARQALNLKTNDVFKKNDHIIKKADEEDILVNLKQCNTIISGHGKSSIEVCIVDDTCKTIALENIAMVKTLRDKLMDSLPEYYRNGQCADIYFMNKEDHDIPRSDEMNIPFQNILQNGGIKAYNKITDNITEVDITWGLTSHQVRVNMRFPLSSLRYWVTKPSDCPNLKSKLNLPDKPLFPNPSNDLAENWLSRDRYAELHKISSSHTVNTQLAAPYDKEALLPIETYTYKIESSPIRRIYYVDVSETEKAAFTGSRTDVFNGDNLFLKISSRSPKDKILLPMKDIRSTNERAVSWTNVVISTNNTAVTITAKFDNHQPGYGYWCELFDFRAKYQKHVLYGYVSSNGICNFRYIYDKDTKVSYDLIFNKEQLIENGEDLTKFRYELGVTIYPHRPGQWGCDTRRKRESSTGNIDITQDQISMGGAGKGGNVGNTFASFACHLSDKETHENKRSLHFNVFIFKSQEIAEKIIEDIPVF